MFAFIAYSFKKSCKVPPPINTVGHPITIDPPCAVMSPIRAAGLPPIITVILALTMLSGGPTQVQRLPMPAAGMPPISTVGAEGAAIGPPTWGIGGTPGVIIGQTCMSPTRAAGCPMVRPPSVDHHQAALHFQHAAAL